MKRSKLLLSPLQKRLLYFATLLLWISGAIWLLLLETNPARPLWMKIHGAAAMLFLLVFGTLLDQHVPAGLRQDEKRVSGAWLIITCGVLILTGWGLYYIGDEPGRLWTSRLHIFLGVALPALIGFHVWLGKRVEPGR